MNLKDYIRDIPDFPQPGILFRDITPLLRNPAAFNYSIDRMAEMCQAWPVDAIVAIESRGFIFGAPLACRLDKPFVPVRKEGKLPGDTIASEYYLEYGSNTVEMHKGDVAPGDRVVIIDDLLATGGTLAAAASLVEESGGEVSGLGLLIELEALGGRNVLGAYDIFSLIQY
ncbi:MAG: adenine phosphoribosyltransferase [Chloroflexi bacterium]|nr:adenine phosphoribosyltransferase [Chloroflexota bacterium]